MFKDRLREARRRAKLTQSQLAEQIGVATSTLTGYEKGNSEPEMNKVQKIMSALGVDANYLWQDEMRDVGIPTEEQIYDLSARVAELPSLLERKISELSRSVSFSESTSSNRSTSRETFLSKFSRLDDHGRRVVEAVLDLELERCESTSSTDE